MPPTHPHDAIYDRYLAQHGMVHTGEGKFVYQGTGAPVDTAHPDVLSRFQQVHAQAQQQLAAGAAQAPEGFVPSPPTGSPLRNVLTMPGSAPGAATPGPLHVQAQQQIARASATAPAPDWYVPSPPPGVMEHALDAPRTSYMDTLLRLYHTGALPTPQRLYEAGKYVVDYGTLPAMAGEGYAPTLAKDLAAHGAQVSPTLGDDLLEQIGFKRLPDANGLNTFQRIPSGETLPRSQQDVPGAATPGPSAAAFTNPMALLEGLLASPARIATLKLLALLQGGTVANAGAVPPGQMRA